MDWLAANWETVAGVAIPIIIAILHATTKHYTDSKGAVKAMLYAIDVLNILGKALKPSDPPRTLKVIVSNREVKK